MSNPSTGDVNESFAAERTNQLRDAANRAADIARRVEAGLLLPLSDGRYRVNDPSSWDNGEVWTLQDGQVLPEHGLDETTGQVALYTSVPAWHELGNVVPGGTSDVEEVLSLGGIGFEVNRRPVLYRATLRGDVMVLPDQFVTVRDDTGAGLGVVGARYEVLQNRQVFEFLQDLVDDYDVLWESAGALRDGRKVFVSLRLPTTVRIDAAGINDEIVPFIAAINSHDGSSQAQVVATPWRPVCCNTERFAVRDAWTRWGVRHTRNARDRIAEARRTLGLSVRYYEQFAAEEEALARTELAIAEFRSLLDELWPSPPDDASALAKTHHVGRVRELIDLYQTNADQLGRTAYAAERTITQYADWKTTLRPRGALRENRLAARATAVLEGGYDELKTKAHRRLLTLTHR